MPSSVGQLFSAAGVAHGGVVGWGEPVSDTGPGIYVVSVTSDPSSVQGLAGCPLSYAALGSLLARRPELTLDGVRPDGDGLAVRIGAFWLPDEPVLYVGKATSLGGRIGQYYSTPLGARSPHAGGWFLKTLKHLDDLFVHIGPTQQPDDAESAAIQAFVDGVSVGTTLALHDPDRPFPFANLEHPPGTRKRHGIAGAKEPRSPAGRSSGLGSGPGLTRPARTLTHHRTQRVTPADIRAGRIRIPSTGSTKRLFPGERTDIVINLRGSIRTVRWDPRYGPDRQRSGVISVGRQHLEGVVRPNEVLRVTVDGNGTVSLD